MTDDETTTDPNDDGPPEASEPTGTPPGTDAEDSDDTADSSDTFPRQVVEDLRRENARYRQRAGRADEALRRLLETTVRSAAADHLADPGDLLAFGDTDGLLDDDGWPDADRIVTAARELAQERPHLAPRRPRGDVGQGAAGSGGSVDLAALLRDRAT